MKQEMRFAADAIKAAGFKAYMRGPSDTWIFFTDGTRIGYLQNDRLEGFKLATVHVPNQTTGTGFSLGPVEKLDKATLETSFATAPPWAYRRDVESVRKWQNWEDLRRSSTFNLEYAEV